MERILNDPIILKKLEKGLEQMSTALRTFSKVCGLLMVESELLLPTSQSGEPAPVDEKDQPASSDSDETSSESQPPLQWDKELQSWMFKESHWGPEHALHVAQFCIGKRYRSDHLKNFWRFTGAYEGLEPGPLSITKPENWRKTSMTTITTLHSTYADEMENAKEYLIYCKNKENELWKSVRGSRQRRIHNVLKATPVSLKTFIKLMKENHCEMPPLRGRKKG